MMKNPRLAIFMLLAALAAMLIFNHSTSLVGTVRDPEGRPIPGAELHLEVHLKGSWDGKRVRAKDDGTFKLKVSHPRREIGNPFFVRAAGFKQLSTTLPDAFRGSMDIVLAPHDSDEKSRFTLEPR